MLPRLVSVEVEVVGALISTPPVTLPSTSTTGAVPTERYEVPVRGPLLSTPRARIKDCALVSL